MTKGVKQFDKATIRKHYVLQLPNQKPTKLLQPLLFTHSIPSWHPKPDLLISRPQNVERLVHETILEKPFNEFKHNYPERVKQTIHIDKPDKFAVFSTHHWADRQYKVMSGDQIMIRPIQNKYGCYFKLGEEIVFGRDLGGVLLVSLQDYTLVGRPILPHTAVLFIFKIFTEMKKQVSKHTVHN